jgi:hypothetical protein
MITFKQLLSEIRASHVTVHDFDKFASNKMKTGEGYHDFGWGIYFTENRGVINFYRSTLPHRREEGLKGTFIVKADLPEVNLLMFWDTPFEDQPVRVRAAIEKIAAQYGIDVNGDPEYFYHRARKGTAGQFYATLTHNLKSAEKVSKLLNSHGVKGLRYLDAGSRGAAVGNRTFNYVIWDVDAINIIHKHKRFIPGTQKHN